MHMSTFAEIIAETGNLLGIDGFEPDAEGVCVIASEEAEVSLLYCPDAGDMVLVTAKLMDLPSDDGNVLVAALEANHRLEATNGATISLDEEENSLVLSMYLPLDLLTAEALVSRLEAFMAAFFSMKEKLSAL